jgi:hypothetical protein
MISTEKSRGRKAELEKKNERKRVQNCSTQMCKRSKITKLTIQPCKESKHQKLNRDKSKLAYKKVSVFYALLSVCVFLPHNV